MKIGIRKRTRVRWANSRRRLFYKFMQYPAVEFLWTISGRRKEHNRRVTGYYQRFHSWFAWYPVKLSNEKWAWFCWIERSIYNGNRCYKEN